jgi:NAD(P)-dependent dehydrogenase (short-subunit alcohol dehydrogenase family)
MKHLEKVAIVTGGGSGIGQATALGLAQAGYAVVVGGRHAEPLAATVRQASAHGSRVMALTTDVSDAESVANLFAKVHEDFGRLDLLFNNAGQIGPAVPVEDVALEEWHSVVGTNLTGAFLCAREAIALMKTQIPRGGRIINNGSLSAHVPRRNSVAYTVSKHGMTGLTKSIALDCRSYDIACSQIDIGNASTKLATEMTEGTLQANGALSSEPTIDVAEVARVVVSMAELPLDTNILFLTVMATQMPFVGRG